MTTPARQKALEGYLESIVKAVATLRLGAFCTIGCFVGEAREVATIRGGLMSRLSRTLPGGTVEALSGIATVAKHAAQGAALLADGLAGGSAAELVQTLGIREATGTCSTIST